MAELELCGPNDRLLGIWVHAADMKSGCDVGGSRLVSVYRVCWNNGVGAIVMGV